MSGDVVIITTLITSIASVLAAAFGAWAVVTASAAKRQAEVTHLLINSRMDELLKAAAALAHAEGVAEGEQAQRDRQVTG